MDKNGPKFTLTQPSGPGNRVYFRGRVNGYLKSFRRQDRDDLRFLCDEGRLRADRLTASLESAFRWTMPKDGDSDRERAFANLEKVIAYLDGRSRAL